MCGIQEARARLRVKPEFKFAKVGRGARRFVAAVSGASFRPLNVMRSKNLHPILRTDVRHCQLFVNKLFSTTAGRFKEHIKIDGSGDASSAGGNVLAPIGRPVSSQVSVAEEPGNLFSAVFHGDRGYRQIVFGPTGRRPLAAADQAENR